MIQPPAADQVHLWWVDLDDDRVALGAEDVLSGDERAAADRVRREPHRSWRIARRAALRRLLAGYVGADPARLELSRTEAGKPVCTEAGGLAFSSSSSGPVGLYGFATAERLGVDVEHRPDGGWSGLPIRRYLSEREQAALAEVAGEGERDALAARAWVVKEAVAKAVGTGLLLPPSGIEVSEDPALPGEPAVRLLGPWSEHASPGWAVRIVRDDGRTVAAVALDGELRVALARSWPDADPDGP